MYSYKDFCTKNKLENNVFDNIINKIKFLANTDVKDKNLVEQFKMLYVPNNIKILEKFLAHKSLDPRSQLYKNIIECYKN